MNLKGQEEVYICLQHTGNTLSPLMLFYVLHTGDPKFSLTLNS